MVEQSLEWRPDPFGAHEMRYFSGEQPTGLIRDGDQEGYDASPLAMAFESGIGQSPSILKPDPGSLSAEAR